MKRMLSLLTGLVVTAGLHAQTAPSEATAEQVKQYRNDKAAECSAEAAQSGANANKGKALCACMFEKLGETVPIADWQAAYFHARNGRQRDEMAVMLPHIRAAVRTCGPSLQVQ